MDDPTLLLHWLFSCLALVVMGSRLIWRKVLKQSFNQGDYLTMGACICCLVRLALIHVVLTWGTNNIPATVRQSKTFTETELYQKEIGSKFTIANRAFYNSFLWLQKLVLLDVYRQLLQRLRFERVVMVSFLLVFFATYVAIQVTTFIECKPFRLYWQVVPDPGECVKALLQLVVVGVLNIITDVMLLVLPIPLFFSLKTSWKRKLRLYVLFTLGIFIIAITVIRLPINAINKDSQVNRTTWASTELLMATIVVNAPTMYGFWNKKKQDSSTYVYAGGSGAPGPHSVRAAATADPCAQALALSTILRTRETTVTRDVGSESNRDKILRTDEIEIASNSSQRSILRDLK